MCYDNILEKAEKILKGNIYETNKYPWGNYRMISPARGHFFGVWNWDSAFHAIGMIPYDIEIAKEQIEGFLQFQLKNGMFPDAILEDGSIADRCTKPPVMAYAALRVFETCEDMEFLKRVYPKLVENEKFWSEKRKHGKLFHYDAELDHEHKSYLECVGFESGWDNSPRWDNAPQDFWAVDLNCFMVDTYRALSKMAEALGENSEIWDAMEQELAEEIENRLWNEELGAYADYNFVKNEFSSVLTPASFMPLYVGVATKNRACSMNEIAQKHFLPGMPTVAYTDKAYDDKYERAYWRGPCWLNVAYFAAKGLMNYGYNSSAYTVRDTILGWVEKDGDFVHENYNATTGEGLCSDHFSWSCVFVREFVENL